MIHLKPPNKGDDIKADLIRDMIKVIQHNKPIAGNGLFSNETEHGTIFSVASSPRKSSTLASIPNTFDIEPSNTAGKMKLVRCYFQLDDKFVFTNDEPEFTPSAGVLYAIVNTASTPTQVTAAVVPIGTSAYNPSTPELIPYALYITDSSGGIVCSCRGMVSIYG